MNYPPYGNYYRGRRVFVTGHTGFKGSWLCLWLKELGADVFGYSLQPPTTPNLFTEARVGELMTGHTIGDIRDPASLNAAVLSARPDVVFHLAAQPLVRLSYREPIETFATNVMGTVNLLEAVLKVPSVKVCQVITSDKCYENDNRVAAFREDDSLGGSDPYSASKGAAEIAVASYRRSFFEKAGVSLASARAGNVIGGGDWAEDRIVPDCIRAFEAERSVQVRNPHAIRPWQHVLEPLNGYLTLAAYQAANPAEASGPWNFGPLPGPSWNVRRVVECLHENWGVKNAPAPQYENPNPNAVEEAKFLKLEISKATTLLNWVPVLTTAEALVRTVDWYRAWSGCETRFNAGASCLTQIREYAARAFAVGAAN